MNGRRASLADAYDPGAARAMRLIAWVFAVLGVVALGSGGGLALAESLNDGVWTIPGWSTALGLVGVVCGVFTLLASAECTHAILGPAEPADAGRAMGEVYPADAPTSSVPLATGVMPPEMREAVVPAHVEPERSGAHRAERRWRP